MEASGKFGSGREPRICIIGAGFSGLTAGVQLKRKLNLKSFTIYDENDGIGGTWLRNTYPGVACDAPSHLYSWSFELNPDWSQTFSSGREILTYMENVTKKYDLYSHIILNTQVISAIWDDNSYGWDITIFDKNTRAEETIHFDIVINGTGYLRVPNIPPEFLSFKGTILHSANWDSGTTLSEKVVGIVGSGASAIQIIPAIAPIVSKLHCYQRNPPYVAWQMQQNYSTIWKFACKHFPPLMWCLRVVWFFIWEIFHSTFVEKSMGQKLGDFVCSYYMGTQIKASSLLRKVTPRYPYGCKRVLAHNEYYAALRRQNVTLHINKIEAIGKNNICTDEKNTKLDVLILATGFKSSGYLDPLQVIGRDGININELWKKDKPSAYLGIMTYNAPNYFFILGPNTFVAHNSVLFMIECQVNYILQVISKMVSENITVLRPTKESEKSYMSEIEKELKMMVWGTGKCESWYNNVRGNVTALWPYNCVTYWRKTRNFNPACYSASPSVN